MNDFPNMTKNAQASNQASVNTALLIRGTQKYHNIVIFWHRNGENYYKAILLFLFLHFQDSSLKKLHFSLKNKGIFSFTSSPWQLISKVFNEKLPYTICHVLMGKLDLCKDNFPQERDHTVFIPLQRPVT